MNAPDSQGTSPFDCLPDIYLKRRISAEESMLLSSPQIISPFFPSICVNELPYTQWLGHWI